MSNTTPTTTTTSDTLYDSDIDFTALALRYPDFAKRLKHNRQLDFSDPESVRQLTKALLHRDFGVQIDLPDDRLCPPVPNRYVLYRYWEESSLILIGAVRADSTTSASCNDYSILRHRHSVKRTTRIGESLDWICIDPQQRLILTLLLTPSHSGTGASLIYPLLALSRHPAWVFLATEIDAKSRSYAQHNIALNDLSSRVKILDVEDDDALIPSAQLAKLGLERVDILLTNPPFYSSAAEMADSAKQKSRPPNSACTGAPIEMIFAGGGEAAFVTKLIHESQSQVNRTTIQWFSTMLGKLSSVPVIADKLRVAQCDNFAITEFIQGTKTRRWCVAWSWMGLRPDEMVTRNAGAGVEKKWLPQRTEFEFFVSTTNVGFNPSDTARKIDTEIKALGDAGMQWQFKPAMNMGIGMSSEGDVWSRKARHRKQRKENNEEMDGVSEEENDEKEPALVFKITVRSGPPPESSTSNTTIILKTLHHQQQQQKQSNKPEENPATAKTTTTVHIRWLQGHDSVLFESFCGWLKRKLTRNE